MKQIYFAGGCFWSTEHYMGSFDSVVRTEVGKRGKALLVSFLEKYKSLMSRTMLRYAIEKFSPEERKWFMKK